MRSCSSSVLVKQTAEQVTPADLGRLIVADEGRSGGWVRRLKTKRPVRPMGVVVLNVDSEHVLEVAASEDQQKPAKADRAPDRAMGSGWTRRVLMTPVWLVGSAHSRCNSAASKTKTFLGSRYRRIVKRRGKKRALVAVGNPGPHHRLPSALGPPGPFRRPRRRLPRPPAPPTPNPAADPRTRTPLRQAGHPPRRRLITGRHRHNRIPPA